jgi:translation elongation factor EF-1alpha
MSKFKLLVIGHGRHGKDTVCEMLRDDYGYTFESSSKFCSKFFIYE